jgi:hypothetical protein
MATKKATPAAKPSKALAGFKPTKSLATIDAEMAQGLIDLKGTIGQSAGNRLTVEVKGSFTTPDGLDLGSEIQVVVLDYFSANKFYTVAFDRDNPAPPDCYAMGRIINDLVPEADSPHVQNKDCRTCPMNAFGSAQNGKGKACQNRRLVAVLIVDPNNPDAHNEPDAPIYLLDLSPSNNKSFDGAVNAVARALNGLPVKAILTVSAENAGTYAIVRWSDPVPNPDYALHYSRKDECYDMLTRRPDFAAHAAKAPVRGRKAAAPAARAGARR